MRVRFARQSSGKSRRGTETRLCFLGGELKLKHTNNYNKCWSIHLSWFSSILLMCSKPTSLRCLLIVYSHIHLISNIVFSIAIYLTHYSNRTNRFNTTWAISITSHTQNPFSSHADHKTFHLLAQLYKNIFSKSPSPPPKKIFMHSWYTSASGLCRWC